MHGGFVIVFDRVLENDKLKQIMLITVGSRGGWNFFGAESVLGVVLGEICRTHFNLNGNDSCKLIMEMK